MFIRYFKSSYLPQYVLLAIITLVLWGYHLIYPEILLLNNELQPAYDLSLMLLAGNKWVFTFSGILLLYLQAMILNKILVDNDIVPKNSLIPAFVFLVVSSASAHNLTYTPLSFAILFLILAIERLFKCYGNTKAFSEILSAGLFISLASLFFFPAIVFVVMIYLILISFSLNNWRLWVIPIIVIILPYIYVYAFYFLTDRFDINIESFTIFWNSIGINQQNPFNITHLGHAFIIILLIISTSYYISHIQEKNIIIRKKMILIVFITCISIALMVSNFGNFDLLFIIAALPLSVFISFYLGDIKVKRYHEYFIYLIILIIVFINYHFL